MAYGDDVMKAIRGTVLDGRPRIGGVGGAEASARARRAAALSAAADYARSGRGGQGDSDMHLERAAEEALSQAALAGLMTYGRSALALGRRTLADQLARRRASPAAVLRRTRYQGGAFGEGVETLSDTALNPSTLTGARPTGRLGEVATVSEEYSRAYPGIERDVVVNVVPDREWAGYVEAAKRARAEWAKTSDTSRGFFDRRLSAVSLRAQMPGETMEAYFDRADRTLVHELQHYAQMRDGLPATSPGSGYEWYRTAAREVDARNSANRLVLTPQERAEIPRSMTQDVRPEDVHMDDKGGDNFGAFRNFLATDDVPESIFGYPVVQDESQYTEKDLEFFRKNPKAAGFYDLGGEEVDEDIPQQATGAGIPMLASIFGPAGLDNLRKANWKNLPELATYKEHGHEIQIGELKDVRLRKGWEQALLRKEKKLSDLLDFSSPQGRRLTTAYPGIQDIPVTNVDLGAEAGAHGGYLPPSEGEEIIWLNPRSVGIKGELPLEEQYAKVLHEGINHAIYSREPSFQGPNVATHDLPSGELTPLGYAMNLNEVLASLASRRGAKRATTGKGEANSAQFVKEIFPEVVRRVNKLTEAELEESQGKMLKEDVVLPRAAVPEDMDPPREEPVPTHLDAKGGVSVDESKTAGLQNRRIALLKALTGEDFSYDGKKWSTKENKFVEE